MRHPRTDLVPTRVSRLVAKEHQVERPGGGLVCPNRSNDRASCRLGVPLFSRSCALRAPGALCLQVDGAVDAKSHRVAQLLDRLRGPEGEDRRLTAVRLDQPDRLLDAALLVRADGETKVSRLQSLSVAGEHHPSSGQRNSFDADKNFHTRIRRFSGSKTGVGPATATVTG